MLVSERAASRALLFGHEESLLSSRKWLLRTIACNCHTVVSLAECKAAMLAEAFDLLILCQSVSSDDCTAASQFSGEHSSATPLLIMFSRHARCVPDQEYVLLDATAGPEAFVQTTSRILARAGELAAGRVS